jgi:hypothetical protein
MSRNAGDAGQAGPPRKPGAKKKGRQPAKAYLWSKQVPLLVRAMVSAGSGLFVAGPPDLLESGDATAAFDGRKGGLLWAVSPKDGNKLSEYKLTSPPVFDGMAAANERLYLSTTNGEVLCFAAR